MEQEREWMKYSSSDESKQEHMREHMAANNMAPFFEEIMTFHLLMIRVLLLYF